MGDCCLSSNISFPLWICICKDLEPKTGAETAGTYLRNLVALDGEHIRLWIKGLKDLLQCSRQFKIPWELWGMHPMAAIASLDTMQKEILCYAFIWYAKRKQEDLLQIWKSDLLANAMPSGEGCGRRQQGTQPSLRSQMLYTQNCEPQLGKEQSPTTWECQCYSRCATGNNRNSDEKSSDKWTGGSSPLMGRLRRNWRCLEFPSLR